MGEGSRTPGRQQSPARDSRSIILGDSPVRGEGGNVHWILQRGSPWRTWNLVAPCEYSSLGGSQAPGLIIPLYSCLSSTAPSSLHPFLCLCSFLSQLDWLLTLPPSLSIFPAPLFPATLYKQPISVIQCSWIVLIFKCKFLLIFFSMKVKKWK